MFLPTSTTPMNENGLVRSSSQSESIKGSIITDKLTNSTSHSTSSSTLNMPSPPLSPYTRNDTEIDNIPNLLFPRATKPLTSDLRLLETYTSPKSVSSALIRPTEKKIPDVTTSSKVSKEKTIVDPPSGESIETQNYTDENALYIDGLNDCYLHINAYQHFNKPGYKRNQLKFLSQYQFKNFNTNSTSTKYASSSSTATTTSGSKSSRPTYESSRATQTENSESDAEKPRTRRLVRQNKYDLESVDSTDTLISRPTTPISVKKRLATSSPSTPKRQRTSTPITYNYDYRKIEDFCPPKNTLPNNNKCLKTDWKGQSMDLSDDPLINELHPAEVVLASILRLPCGVYLDSKRRIFQEKVKRMRYNLPFRRTDAQKSCKIDVNKASRLFAAFEKVGWFDEKHFQKFM
ncbi:hypothetical protein CANINC_001507 [Pichia inconspicua]|uniref:SWIRM domain-containing protein n=1 Tax=Pichia inconspicua TaxID=52247 RepID=A0A4T0X419_9ASCO|nr:hypothetical protein CANINC_001507 [[Candida] inconspicua]